MNRNNNNNNDNNNSKNGNEQHQQGEVDRLDAWLALYTESRDDEADVVDLSPLSLPVTRSVSVHDMDATRLVEDDVDRALRVSASAPPAAAESLGTSTWLPTLSLAKPADACEFELAGDGSIFDAFHSSLECHAASEVQTPPELPLGYYDKWSSFKSEASTETLIEGLRAVLSAPGMHADVTFVDSQLSAQGVVVREHASATFAVSVFSFEGSKLVEFQRRCGDRLAFRCFFADAVAALQERGLVSDDFGNATPVCGLRAMPAPEDELDACVLVQQIGALFAQPCLRTDAMLTAVRLASREDVVAVLAQDEELVARINESCCEVLRTSSHADCHRTAATLLALSVEAAPEVADRQFTQASRGMLPALFGVLAVVPAPEEAFLQVEIKRQLCRVVRMLSTCSGSRALLKAYHSVLSAQLACNCTDATIARSLTETFESLVCC